MGRSPVYCHNISSTYFTYKVDTWAGAQAECDSLGGFLVEAKLVTLRVFLSNFSIIVYFVEVKYNSGLSLLQEAMYSFDRRTEEEALILSQLAMVLLINIFEIILLIKFLYLFSFFL